MTRRARVARIRGAALPAVLAVACGAGCGSAGPVRVTIAAHAATRFADAPAAIVVRGLPDDRRTVLEARWTAFGGAVWASRTPLRRRADGAAVLRGIRGMRVLWGMRPVRPAGRPQVFLPPARGPSDVALAVRVAGRTVARASLPRRITAPSVRVRRLTVRRDGVSGVLFLPPGGGRRSAALLLGGSEGGNNQIDAAGLLAAHGHPALALAYFAAPGLPARLERIPLEYFARALRILSRAPGVDPGRVTTMGASFGGEAALLVAATFPRLDYGAIGLVPNVSASAAPGVPGAPAWTHRGAPVPLGPIALDRINGPVLVAGGGLDNVWDSPLYVQEIRDRLADASPGFAETALVFPRAGHHIGVAIPYLPQPTDQARFGGTPAADAAALAVLWPRILRFLDDLGRGAG